MIVLGHVPLSVSVTLNEDVFKAQLSDAVPPPARKDANVVNAAVFSKWNYFDPEYHGDNGLQNITPVPRTYNFGMNLTL